MDTYKLAEIRRNVSQKSINLSREITLRARIDDN